MTDMFENGPESNVFPGDVRRADIAEAMAREIDGHSWMTDPDEGSVCACGEALTTSLEYAGDAYRSHIATAALDAALPLIREALAEKVRDGMHTVEMARKAVRAGVSVGEVDAWDAALEEAALLIEEVEL